MRIPSAEAARASTQAVLLAYLCDRYHDLASYASESLKQRVHFLTKPDGSNLKDLFIWDTPLSTRSLLLGEGEGEQTTPCWTPNQIQDYIQQYWSADQFPLHPPNNCNSWETVDVYFKELDQETVQAMVPIGVQDKDGVVITLLVVLTAELVSGDHQDEHLASSAGARGAGGRTLGASSATKQGEKSAWKYHDMVAVKTIHWELNGWTILLPEHHLKDPQSSSTLSGIDSRANVDAQNDEEEKEDKDLKGDEEDSDDDYWGQYGDAEDESAADETNDKTKHNRDPSGATSETPLDEDAEEELYWRKYSEQQEEQEEIERKKKMEEQQQDPLQQSSAAAAVVHHLGLQESSKAPTPLPGQVDPNMLSSLLQSLVMEGVQNMYPASFPDLDLQQQHEQQQQQQDFSVLPPSPLPPHQQTANVPATVTDAAPMLDITSPLPSSNLAQDKLMDSMRSLVADCTRAGYTKDQVFAMMETVYKSHAQ
ncbi:MAG: hypothetical protein J3R72DRAFT_441102 [Linnemannia gamsii]|nr:MAG: hypothetical protein J3R72DRAFT_441102 [Linnemannia gamsii]